MTARLVDRTPQPGPDRLLAELVPPSAFGDVRFDSYRPDPQQPTQRAAVERLSVFVGTVGPAASGRRRGLLRRRVVPAGPAGVYLDGGFGVGKTHLLASTWHAAAGPKAYGTFVAYTQLVGALGFARAVEALSGFRLLCIDEFELDDPGDTVLMSTLLGRLVGAGVRLAATSNTLPDALGEGRFAADDFQREIQALSAHFEVLRVDGDDYRHRGVPVAPAPWEAGAARGWAAGASGVTCDDFEALCAHLGRLHPSRYDALLDDVTAVVLTGAHPVSDQSVALRLVVLVDRLYEHQVPVLLAGERADRLFTEQLLHGGHRKKYLRALSRLTALTALAPAASC